MSKFVRTLCSFLIYSSSGLILMKPNLPEGSEAQKRMGGNLREDSLASTISPRTRYLLLRRLPARCWRTQTSRREVRYRSVWGETSGRILSLGSDAQQRVQNPGLRREHLQASGSRIYYRASAWREISLCYS